jgi:hypothetical protein
MASVLEEGKVLKRVIRLHGINKPVVIEISTAGVSIYVKGARKHLHGNWYAIVNKAMETPADVPSYLMGKPWELLEKQAK